MIVSPQEYNSLLHRLTDPNKFTAFLRIPEDEPIHKVDLEKRFINVPEFLSVEKDHNSEIIWFEIDRFYDNIDLYNGSCWIQYINADGEEYFYNAPLYVVSEKYGSDKIIFPWAISKQVAKKSGVVQFSFQFFKLSEDGNRFLYVLNTQPAKSKILTGMFIDPTQFLEDDDALDDDYIPQREWLADQIKVLTDAYNTLTKDYELYWIEV